MNYDYLKAVIAAGIILSLTASTETKNSINYCDEQLCPHQGKHVRCDNNGDFSKDCIGEYKLEDMTPYIPLILFEHNMYRNQVASGKLKCFNPATRMPALIWDWELAKNAEYNAKSCVFEHDKCRSTPEYPYAGQNIYYAKTSRLNITVEQFIAEAIFLWYEEYLDADAKLMEEYHRTEPQTGHFTTLMGDRQNKVGCSFLNNLQNDGRKLKRMIIFTCDYPSTNVKKMHSYKPGVVAADCKDRNKKFSALCDDKIDPNDIYWYDE